VFAEQRVSDAERAPAGGVALRVLTYNIHHGEGVDGKLALERIARLIMSVQPDLVALQEVDQRVARTGEVDQPAELARLTGLHVVFGGNIDLQGGRYGNAVLSRFPVVRHRNHRLPCFDNGEQRGVLDAEIEVPGVREPLRFLATHLDHRPDDRERLASVEAINQLIFGSARSAILAGDLNATPESDALRTIDSVWTRSQANLPTIPVAEPSRQIDYVLFRPAGRWQVDETRVLDEAVASDHRPLLAVLSLGESAAASHVAPATPRLPRDNLRVHRGPDDTPQPVRTIDDWLRRRDEIVRGMEAVMGRLPGPEKRCPLDIQIEEEVDRGSYVRRLITYASEPGSRVPAYLLVPKAVLEQDGLQVPAILCLHGTDNAVGHGTVVGLGERPNRQYASELAERGYVTLAPSYPLLAKYQPEIRTLGWESGTLKAVWDNLRGIDLLASLPYVKPGAFGAIGHSLGGHNSVYTSVFDERIRVVVSSCGLDSYLDYYDGDEKVWLPEKGWTQTRYMPRLADYRGRLAEIPFDFHELIGSLAPRHVLIVAPLHDSNFRAASVDRVAAAARPVFELYGVAERLQVTHPDCGHDFPPEMREQAYALFERVLR
jgi:endonuclease/exonuclease/phosphatase family metal-dependent hydrolase